MNFVANANELKALKIRIDSGIKLAHGRYSTASQINSSSGIYLVGIETTYKCRFPNVILIVKKRRTSVLAEYHHTVSTI